MRAVRVRPSGRTLASGRQGAIVGAVALALLASGCGEGSNDPKTGGRHAPVRDGSTKASSSGGSGSRRTPAASAAAAPATGPFAGLRVPPGNGATVSFTFDDGPSAEYTPKFLALLRANRVPAVFCLIGQHALALPRLVRDEARAGDRLCDHSWDHDLFMNRKGPARVRFEVDEGIAAIRVVVPGVPVRFYRQPGGFWSPVVVTAMTRARLSPLRWTDDPKDWSRPGARTIARRVLTRLRPGAVILMHDGGGDRSQTLEALAWLLPALHAAGWTFTYAPQEHLTLAAAARPE